VTRRSNVLKVRRIPLFPLTIIILFIVTAVGAPILAPYTAYELNLSERLKPPFWQTGGSRSHPLGTDTLGRDLLSRIIFGSRVSLLIAILTLLVGGFIGTGVGIISGFSSDRVDAVLMRITDSVLAFPIILFALLLMVALGPRISNIVVGVSFVLWARIARVIRGEVLSLKTRDFIAQARIVGCSTLRIMVRHIFPNILNTLVVLLTLQLGWVIIVEATLSFLGAGVPPPQPAWGSLVASGRDFITTAWWLSLFPGVSILLVVLAFNLFGDWLRDTLDPKLRQV
jgi:peptide/nickel transport system permease protein